MCEEFRRYCECDCSVIEEKWDKEYSVEFNNGDQFFRLHM